jgi:hypothetical protein
MDSCHPMARKNAASRCFLQNQTVGIKAWVNLIIDERGGRHRPHTHRRVVLHHPQHRSRPPEGEAHRAANHHQARPRRHRRWICGCWGHPRRRPHCQSITPPPQPSPGQPGATLQNLLPRPPPGSSLGPHHADPRQSLLRVGDHPRRSRASYARMT